MKKLWLYRQAIRLLPRPRYALEVQAGSLPSKQADELLRILKKHRSLGGAVALFDASTTLAHVTYGLARRGMAVQGDTAFRLASVSKMVTAAGILAMVQKGLLSLSADADQGLPYSLRHPRKPEMAITLMMLLSHTAGIMDGQSYTNSLTGGMTAAQVLAGDSHTTHLPGEGCEYSNLGVGLVGPVVEAVAGLSFENAMQQHLFAPLGMQASYYPSHIKAPLADARRVLPPRRKPNFNAAARQAAPAAQADKPDLDRHYLLAHGSCLMDMPSAIKLGQALLSPGFFSASSLEAMHSPYASLGKKDPRMRQGLGTFVLEDPAISQTPLHGHQGLAYGGVQLLMLDKRTNRGLISFTTGASEAREYILTDLNKDLLRWWLFHD